MVLHERVSRFDGDCFQMTVYARRRDMREKWEESRIKDINKFEKYLRNQNRGNSLFLIYKSYETLFKNNSKRNFLN